MPLTYHLFVKRQISINALLSGFIGILSIFAYEAGHFSTSALVHVSNNDAIASLAKSSDPHFTFVNSVSHYDGVYYYAMGIDPLGIGKAHTLIDLAPYRYGHPLQGWFAYFLSFGQPKLVPNALVFITISGIMLSSYIFTKLALRFGYSPWLGLFISILPGMIFSVQNSTTENLGLALIGFLLYFWDSPNRYSFLLLPLFSMLVCLDKEQYVLIVGILSILEFKVALQRVRSWMHSIQRICLLLVGPCILALWYIYVDVRLGSFPNHYESGNFGLPFVGWFHVLGLSAQLQTGSFEQSQIGSLASPILIFYAVVFLATLFKSFQIQNCVGFAAITQICVIFCLDWRTLLYPHEILREPAVSVSLCLFVLAGSAQKLFVNTVAIKHDDGKVDQS